MVALTAIHDGSFSSLVSFVATSTLSRYEHRNDLYRRDLDIETEVTVGFHFMVNRFPNKFSHEKHHDK